MSKNPSVTNCHSVCFKWTLVNAYSKRNTIREKLKFWQKKSPKSHIHNKTWKAPATLL